MAYVGLDSFHAAIYDPALKTYTTPVKLSPATAATVTPNFTSVKMYGDDRAVYIEEALGDIAFELSTTDLTTEHYALLLGKTTNADGVVVDSVDDQAPYVAILFRMKLAGGGYKYFAYYQGKFQTPGTSATTKGESIEFAPETLTGSFIAREDGKWRAHLNSNDVGAEAAALAWFTEVYEPTVIPAG
jgi:phi13 family phage major tail protein